MTEAVLNLDEHTSRILNIIKEQYNLKDQSEAINLMALQYEEKILERPYSPEFIKEMQEIMAEDHIHIPDGMSLIEYIDSLPDEDDK
ncbi:hypothetical protein MSHOH_2837 [Methanosarcina horonobensis HB-1 = JCM 15518]|uniref:Antitoxin n=1 Tax=Methanosarcina horonobensis HB-1 = JCM 15518 TaxID=1434110 RepID=A0A0E3WUJ2_9EURY|nr:DUF2683 family protein [Methanosarcina horonobensis]AKB79320.1 hypothetical protein MSHOH_2837 [Methanosarcina horonobensis HB-1 = JCM 15518]